MFRFYDDRPDVVFVPPKAIPHPECLITVPHGEHLMTIVAGPLAGARVDCPGRDL